MAKQDKLIRSIQTRQINA